MVKSKKLSRGSLAVLLLALMLALSMVVGITGAWFTDAKEQQIQNQTFGTIVIDVNNANPLAAAYTNTNVSGEGQIAMPMPGSQIRLTGKFANTGTAAAYVLYDVKITNITPREGLTLTSEELAAWQAAFWSRTGIGAENDSSKYLDLEAVTCSNLVAVSGADAHFGFFKAAEGQTVADVLIEASIKNSLPNSYQGAKFDVEIGIYAIQQANMTDATAYAELVLMRESSAARTVNDAWTTHAN